MKVVFLKPFSQQRSPSVILDIFNRGSRVFAFFFVREENDTGFLWIAWIPDQVGDKRREL